ncbi:MAG: PAS domain S-box protein [Verrucomicrobia bacterium]|nr:PAS domain S-box protein [Verrucomicrobiota bacterium]MBU1736253.1 PAS domain S-box protein [Verrucomicrobiota bacterium]MBU1856965.1 PAS domain S-box protein [Verrucomicrobiota bacterium]
MKKDTKKLSDAAKHRHPAKEWLGSNKQYRALFDSAGDAIFIHDSKGRILAVNTTACEQYGYTRSELMSMTASLMVIPEKRIHVKKRFAQMMKRGRLKFETVHQRKDGTSLPIEVNSRRITWNGQAAIMSICHDITERKRAEQMLIETAEDKFKTIFNHASDGIILADPENKKFYTGNNAFCRMLGYRLEEITKLSVMDIHPGKDLPYVMEQFKGQAMGNFTLAKDMPVKRKDGSVFYADINATVMTIAGKIYMVGFFRDITEHRQTEKALKTSEQKTRAVFDQTFQFIGLMTTDGTLIEANRTALEFGGIETSSVLGKPFWETPWWTHSPELQEKLRLAIKKGAQGEFIRFEATHFAKDGTLHYVDFSLKPVKDEAGKVIFLIPEGRDITERKQVEDEVRKLNESLEKRVQERTTELARANQELETLIRIASHDLRSPLVNIQGFNQLLNKAWDVISRILADAVLPDETRQALVASHEKAAKAMRFINAGVEKMNGLISGLLRLSQLGRAPLVLQTLNMNALLQSVVEAMAFQIRTAAAEVTVDDLPACRADATLISQVFSNLLDNAIKYRDPARPLRVQIWGHQEKDARVVYCVEDNGLGVAPEYQQKIWNLFYRLNPQGSGAGEGVGLPTVQRIVERHGGKVWMESEVGRGSRFFLALPAAAKEAAS